MSFFIGRGFAELQILKKWKWSYLLNWVEYCDEHIGIKSCLLPCFGTFKMPILMLISILVFHPEGQI